VSGSSGTSGNSGSSGTAGSSGTSPTVFSRGGTFWASGSSIGQTLVAVPVWQVPFTCTATKVRGYRISGSGGFVNARTGSGGSLFGSYVNLSITETWVSSSAYSHALGIGDTLFVISSGSGTSEMISVQVDFTL
jgi:hypothetical protein